MKTPPHRHIIPALREWLMESYQTIHLRVDVDQVPDLFLKSYAHEGVLVLNVSPGAIEDFHCEGAHICFNARFSGRQHEVFISATSVIGVYAVDSNDERYYHELPRWEEPIKKESPPKKDKPTLSIVK